jgi:D-tyrosyl-tRNA(Tyr) deacylase
LRALIQRVREARVTVANRIAGEIGPGVLVLAASRPHDDADTDRDWLARKIVSLRIFDDEAGVHEPFGDRCRRRNPRRQSVHALRFDEKGCATVVVGRRATGRGAPAFRRLRRSARSCVGPPVATGEFGATMQVALVNDGPVTIWIDTRERE